MTDIPYQQMENFLACSEEATLSTVFGCLLLTQLVWDSHGNIKVYSS